MPQNRFDAAQALLATKGVGVGDTLAEACLSSASFTESLDPLVVQPYQRWLRDHPHAAEITDTKELAKLRLWLTHEVETPLYTIAGRRLDPDIRKTLDVGFSLSAARCIEGYAFAVPMHFRQDRNSGAFYIPYSLDPSSAVVPCESGFVIVKERFRPSFEIFPLSTTETRQTRTSPFEKLISGIVLRSFGKSYTFDLDEAHRGLINKLSEHGFNFIREKLARALEGVDPDEVQVIAHPYRAFAVRPTSVASPSTVLVLFEIRTPAGALIPSDHSWSSFTAVAGAPPGSAVIALSASQRPGGDQSISFTPHVFMDFPNFQGLVDRFTNFVSTAREGKSTSLLSRTIPAHLQFILSLAGAKEAMKINLDVATFREMMGRTLILDQDKKLSFTTSRGRYEVEFRYHGAHFDCVLKPLKPRKGQA